MKMKFNILFLSAFVIVLLSSCEKTIELDIDQTPQNVVIEGYVTDIADHNFVRLSKTNDFYAGGQTPRITDATVMVEDSDGNIFNFIHYSGLNADSAGMYFPETPFAGVIGKTYKLTVVTGGVTYTAEDELLRLVPMDKLEYRVNEEEREDPEDEGYFYEVLLFVQEPKDTKDYYLFKCFRNDTLKYANENDIYFSDDELIGENIEGVPLPLLYAQNDLAGVEVYSLTRAAFIYYRDLQKLLTNDGGLFGTPPANPRTNISGGALGFFQVSAIQEGEILIE
jgi:hypothetical protein